MRPVAIVVLSALCASGCYTNAVINTEPPGAKVFVQWQYSGLSPVKVRLKDGFIDGTRYYVRIEKPGYKKQETVLPQDLSAGGIVADALLLFPTLFYSVYLCALNCQRHRDHYDFLLEPEPAYPQYPNPQYPNPQYPNPQYPNPQYPNPQYPNPQYPNPQVAPQQ